MHALWKDRHWRLGAIMAFALSLSLMQGCIEVKVSTTCPPGTSGKEGDGGSEPKPGACNKVTIVNAWPVDNNTWYANNPTVQVPSGQGYTCNVGGKRCRTATVLNPGAPGQCILDGPNCKTWFTPTSGDPKKGDCECDCSDAH